MSHFVVLVIGDDPECQLAPFHEYECTGIDDQYIQDIDITEEARKQYVKTMEDRQLTEDFATFVAADYEYSPIAATEEPDRKGVHKYGYYVTDADGNVLKVVRRTNPNKKWDWYVLGGRWGGFFLTKDGQKVDQARKRDIDFDAIFVEAKKHAGETWDEVHTIANGRPIPNWAQIREAHGSDIEVARREYHTLDVVADLRKEGYWGDLSQYDCPREQFCESHAKSTIRTFAVVRNGQWYEHGQMGWWGIVTDEKDDDVWSREYDQLVADLPDDTLLSVYDCHI